MLFFELLQVALGTREKLSKRPSEYEWKAMFVLAQKQAVAGIAFSALDKLSAQGQKPPKTILYEWISIAEQIKQRNILMNTRSVELIQLFDKNGFKSCILKGQGNALMYTEPLLRTSGDIDIWVSGAREEIIDFCRSRVESCNVSSLHIQFPIWPDVDTEVHFMPSYSRVPRYTRPNRLFFLCFNREEIDGKDQIPEGSKLYVPSNYMNLVFQMSHMARHFFNSGLGLRQMIDYFYLLKYTFGQVEVKQVLATLQHLGLYKFSGAVMWVLKEVFCLEDNYLLGAIDEKRGKMLLDEALKTGNFGKYDQRLSAKLMNHSTTLSILSKNLKMVRLFPEEAFVIPLMNLWTNLKHLE